MSSPCGKSFLDTNIFVYTFDQTAPAKREKASFLVTKASETRQSIISYQVVQEFLNVATRKFKMPLSPLDAQTYLTRVLLPLCEVYPDAALFAHALSISDEVGISFLDALIVSSALSAGCTLLLSEDLRHGRQIGRLRIQNPFQ